MRGFRKLFVCLFLVGALSSCVEMGPKPDKRITAALAFDVSSQAELERAFQVLYKKFDKLGATPKINQIESAYQCYFTLETAADPEVIESFLLSQGRLEFHKTVERENVMELIYEIDSFLAKRDTVSENPFMEKLAAIDNYASGTPMSFKRSDTAFVNELLRKNSVRNLFGPQKNKIHFKWGRMGQNEVIPLYALLYEAFKQPAMSGSIIETAAQTYSYDGAPAVTLQMNEKAAAEWEDLTLWAYENRGQIAIVVDDLVYSAPGVASGPIHGGRSEITGSFTEDEARAMAAILEAGMLPKVELLSYTVQPIE